MDDSSPSPSTTASGLPPNWHAPFTNDPTLPPTSVYPHPGFQVLSVVLHLLSISVLAYCFARRTFFIQGSRWGFRRLTWARVCVMVVLADSWLFVFVSGTLVNGVGMSLNAASCQAGLYGCVILYALSKVFIYWFLIEKVYVVWNAGTSVSRLKSTLYRCCLGGLVVYAVVFVLMMIGRVSYFNSKGECIIGLKAIATVPLVSYDMVLNIVLTGLFVYPIRKFARSKSKNIKLKRVAQRALATSLLTLTTSAINVLVLIIMKGQELSWVCMSCCVTDVTVNALAIFWVTSGPNSITWSSGGPEPEPIGGVVSVVIPTLHITVDEEALQPPEEKEKQGDLESGAPEPPSDMDITDASCRSSAEGSSESESSMGPRRSPAR